MIRRPPDFARIKMAALAVCHQCGKPLPATARRHARFCSPAHRAAHHRSSIAGRLPRVRFLTGAGRDNPSDIYAFGREAAPLVAECKARGNGGGFVQLERWLGEYDLLVLKRAYADPLVLLPWRIWARLLGRGRP
jgi:hypothetical protein